MPGWVLGSLKPQDQRAGADRTAGAASMAGKGGHLPLPPDEPD
jgi:hypothetical protein